MRRSKTEESNSTRARTWRLRWSAHRETPLPVAWILQGALLLMTLSRARSPRWIPCEGEGESAKWSIGFLLPSPTFSRHSCRQSVCWYSTNCFSHRAQIGHMLAFFLIFFWCHLLPERILCTFAIQVWFSAVFFLFVFFIGSWSKSKSKNRGWESKIQSTSLKIPKITSASRSAVLNVIIVYLRHCRSLEVWILITVVNLKRAFDRSAARPTAVLKLDLSPALPSSKPMATVAKARGCRPWEGK